VKLAVIMEIELELRIAESTRGFYDEGEGFSVSATTENILSR
jgi:hypothetical protein